MKELGKTISNLKMNFVQETDVKDWLSIKADKEDFSMMRE